MRWFESLLGRLGITRISGHTFFPRLVPDKPVLLDLGSHRAAFTHGLVQSHGPIGRGICVEANPGLVAELQNSLPENCGVLHAAVVGDESLTSIELYISNNPEASSMFAQVADSYGTQGRVRVACLTMAQLLDRLDRETIDIVKMDIEGAENEVLLKASPEVLLRITQLCVEFHDIFSPEMAPVVKSVRSRLKSLGFAEVNANWPYTDDILFINPAKFARAGIRFRMRVGMANFAYRFRGSVFRLLRRSVA